jgi:signal transduction histidine kinase
LSGIVRRLLPADLRGQVAGILLLGLALSQALAAVLYIVLLPRISASVRPDTVVAQMEMAMQVLETLPLGERASVAARWSRPGFALSYDPEARESGRAADVQGDDPELRALVAQKLGRSPAQIEVTGVGGSEPRDTRRIAVRLAGGGLLSVVVAVGLEHPAAVLQQLAAIAFLLLATAGLWAWLTRTVNAPLTRFARSAELVGLDPSLPPLEEKGPLQLRRVVRAFNEMQVRLQRFLDDRTRMLGAISHDLRTPLTRLRLRIETGRADEDRPKMLDDIETMEAMLSSTLTFIRAGDDVEIPDAVDLAALLQTVCDLASDLGAEVSYAGPAHLRYHCKAQAMMRALTNVVSNATKYGRSAQIALRVEEGTRLVIEVDDEGPGIADAEKERVFEPFYRAECAREIDSKGMGLGLPIARSLILAHGGSIQLLDRTPRGLRVRIELPVAEAVRTESAQ